MATIPDKKKEAIKRMKALGLFEQVIEQFDKENMINQSEPPLGASYWLEPEQLEHVRQFEKEHNAIVYHVIHNWTNFGELENYLFVSDIIMYVGNPYDYTHTHTHTQSH